MNETRTLHIELWDNGFLFDVDFIYNLSLIHI
mgnify:CR=1 FL=1